MTTPATPTPAGPTFDWPGIGLALVVGAAGGAAPLRRRRCPRAAFRRR